MGGCAVSSECSGMRASGHQSVQHDLTEWVSIRARIIQQGEAETKVRDPGSFWLVHTSQREKLQLSHRY